MKIRLRCVSKVEQDRAHYDGAQLIKMDCPGREDDPLFSCYAQLEYWDHNRGGWMPAERN